MGNPIEYLAYNIKRKLEEYWFYHKRILRDMYYDEDTEKWLKIETKKWYTTADEIYSSWYEGERDFVYSLEMKMVYTFFKLKRDGNHAWWYTYYHKDLSAEDKKILFDKAYNDKLKSCKKPFRIWYGDKRIEIDPKTKEMVVYDDIKEVAKTKEVQYYSLDSAYYTALEYLENKRQELRVKRDMFQKSGDEESLKNVLKELEDIQKEIDEHRNKDSFVGVKEKTLHRLVKSEDQTIDMNIFMDEFLKDVQTIELDPSIYIKLSEKSKKECRGRRTDLCKLLEMRRKLLKAYYTDEDRLNSEEYEKQHELKKAKYREFIDYFVDNIGYIWD